jgi:NitT/TauT family transport system permease protein
LIEVLTMTASRAPSSTNRLTSLVASLQPILFGAAVLFVWEITVRWFSVSSLLLPAPTAVFAALVKGVTAGNYNAHLIATLSATALGYSLGCAGGIALGAAIAEWTLLRRVVFPLVVAIQSVPKIALAPLFVMWFGFGLLSKTVTIALLCFFPLLVNTMTAVSAVDSDRISLLRAMTASRWQVFREVKLFSAALPIFAGLQVSVVLALIGALVAEFIGSDAGLGLMIETARANLDTAGMFAVLVVLAAIGLAATKMVQLIQHRVVFWEARNMAVARSAGGV